MCVPAPVTAGRPGPRAHGDLAGALGVPLALDPTGLGWFGVPRGGSPGPADHTRSGRSAGSPDKGPRSWTLVGSGPETAHDHGVSAGNGPGTRLPCMITGPCPSTAPRYAMTTGTSGQPRPRRPDRRLPQRGHLRHDAPPPQRPQPPRRRVDQGVVVVVSRSTHDNKSLINENRRGAWAAGARTVRRRERRSGPPRTSRQPTGMAEEPLQVIIGAMGRSEGRLAARRSNPWRSYFRPLTS